MSNLILFSPLDGLSRGQLAHNLNRGWAINEAADTSLTVEADQVTEYLTLGTIVYAAHPTLPAWAGMVDTKWVPEPPVEMKVYDIAWTLRLLSPPKPLSLRGTTAQIAAALLEDANGQRDTLIRMGETSEDRVRPHESTTQDYWTQLKALVSAAGMEMTIRAGRDADGRLDLRLDVVERLGYDIDFTLHDGDNGNIEVTQPGIDGEIWNVVYGAGTQATKGSRLYTRGVYEDPDSIARFMKRSRTHTFPQVTDQESLEERTAVQLLNNGQPMVMFKGAVLESAFPVCGLGNRCWAHFPNWVLPGGKRGWRGLVRFAPGMSFDETTNKINAVFVGYL